MEVTVEEGGWPELKDRRVRTEGQQVAAMVAAAELVALVGTAVPVARAAEAQAALSSSPRQFSTA
jgi:hypothetical protein